jgi:putative transposase
MVNKITVLGSKAGKPQQNEDLERYNRRLHRKWLDQSIIEPREEAPEHATEWLWTCNNNRPSMTICGIIPAMKLKMNA